jgi:hypothetical protein
MSHGSKEHASKDSLDAMKENDRRAAGSADAVPGEDSEHAHSAAAHLHGAKPHTKAAGDLRDLEDKEETTRDNGRARETYRNA